MLTQRKRFVLLSLIMVGLIGAITVISTNLLYRTALQDQKSRMVELVKSQANLIMELERAESTASSPDDFDSRKDLLLRHLAHAHQRALANNRGIEYTLAGRVGNTMRFLVINGARVPSGNPMAEVPLKEPQSEAMSRALQGTTGTLVITDEAGHEYLAAFTPIPISDTVYALVAKIDLWALKEPYFQANFHIFIIGILLTSAGLFLFFKMSNPIINQLQQSESNYRDLVEGAEAIIIRLDAQGNVTFANSYAASFLDYKEEDLISVNLLHLFAARNGNGTEDTATPTLDEVLSRFAASNGSLEIPLNPGSATERWVEWTCRKQTSPNGLLESVLCIGHDITARHRARAAHRDMEERFRGIAKASPVGIAITDIAGNLLYANERMHFMLGMPPAEMIGQGWINRVHPEDKAMVKYNWFKEQKVGIDRIEFRIKNKQAILWTLGQIVELKNGNGEKVGLVITLTDISRIKQAEMELQRLTAAIDQAGEAIVITDKDGNIAYTNPAFEQISGYSSAEVIGKNPRMLLSDEHPASFYRELWKTIASGEVWTGRLINFRKNGERYIQESTIGPVRDKFGKIINYVSVSRDITGQLAVESHMQHAQKLESIGELAAGIAHEINTPAQYVTTNVQFLEEAFDTLNDMLSRCRPLVNAIAAGEDISELKESAAKALDEEELEFLAEDVPNAIKESVTGLSRISEIVQSVKQLAHPGEVRKSLHNLNHIASNAATVSTNEWKYVATVEMDLDETLPEIFCLKGEIGQVVLNLIVNGAHAIEAKFGPNSEEKGVIRIQSFHNKDSVCLSVSDNGSGMSESVLKRAFDPFFTTKEVGKGTGQGLAIAHNVIVNMHCGKIDVNTVLGEGTTFTLQLPIRNECLIEEKVSPYGTN